MKKLSKEELARVVRELDECPALVRWVAESREENRVQLEACSADDFRTLQGENHSLKQILDKVPDR